MLCTVDPGLYKLTSLNPTHDEWLTLMTRNWRWHLECWWFGMCWGNLQLIYKTGRRWSGRVGLPVETVLKRINKTAQKRNWKWNSQMMIKSICLAQMCNHSELTQRIMGAFFTCPLCRVLHALSMIQMNGICYDKFLSCVRATISTSVSQTIASLCAIAMCCG